MPIYKGSTNQGLVYYGSPNTNCITSVPKNIKLELNNGTLTLKAGSKVYVPNGKNADGSLKFDEYVTSSDIVDTDFGNASKEVAFLATKVGNGVISVWNNPIVVSGTSTPDFSGTGYWGVWYDTANNIIKCQAGSNEWIISDGFSLPFCLVSSSSSAVTSVDQIFDWCGFIGSTAFVLPGVKGLKPNGIKADGTYNNIEIEIKSVLLNQYDYQATGQQFGISGGGNYIYRTGAYYSQATAPAVTPYSIWHNTKDNFNYYTVADTSPGWVKTPDYDFPAITNISTDSSFKITSLTPAKVQPLSTGIQITKVYKGSTLVYMFGFDPVTFTASGTWKVPPGIRQIRVDCVAGQGFSNAAAQGGYGGRVQCILNVTPGQILGIKVGNQNTAFNVSENASAIYTGGAWTSGYLIIAGGGGGAAYTNYLQIRSFAGGIGGGLTGGIGGNIAGAANNNATIGIAGGGGSQTAGGSRGYFSMYLKSLYATNGSQFTGGAPNAERSLSGAGGQGFFGGGGAVEGYYYKGSSEYGASCAAAGGGSSYTNPTLCSSVVHTQGYKAGNGYITISMV